MKRVTGANSPTLLCKFVRTEGWTPTSATIHVSNLKRLVDTLGGQNLYGGADNFAIVMRELMQNARDAVAARKSFSAQCFTGELFVRITSKSNTQTFVEIRDDGVGMSERTMTGALLDFGTSFWASDLVQSEFPGLRSSSFRPVGKFGIGFYTVFMVASEVLVASKRFEKGLSDVTRLHFPDGLTLRPILAKGAEGNYDVATSTSVRLTIDEPIDCITNRWIDKGQVRNELEIPVQNYLAAITAGLDVSVKLQIENGTPVTVHECIDNLDTPEKILGWIEGIAFVNVPNVRNGANLKKYLSENAERVKDIKHDGHLVAPARGQSASTADRPSRPAT
jgi:Histidine kinase-, DNA gyrase B-, and HSP90-like ATPase